MATKAVSSTTPALTIKQAAAAIVERINARPISPRQDEIEAIVARAAGGPALPAMTALSETQARLFEAIQECVAGEKAFTADLPDDQYEAAEARCSAARELVRELAEQLTTSAPSDIALRAGVAWCLADKTDGVLDGLSDDADDADRAVARLIEAVLQLAGINLH